MNLLGYFREKLARIPVLRVVRRNINQWPLNYRNMLARVRVLRDCNKGEYRFPWHEQIKYLRHGECPCLQIEMPSITEIERVDDFVLLHIGDSDYFWPANLNYSGLAWMHAEVFRSYHDNFHAYEFGQVTLRAGDVVVDAGACEGFFVRYALQKKTRVIAVEPTPQVAAALNRTFASDINTACVRIKTCALGARTMMGHLDIRHRAFENRIAVEGSQVSVMSLDDLVEGEQIDFIKMDIEGAEMDALLGASHILTKMKPRLSIAVYHAVDNARLVMKLIKKLNPTYQVSHRGIFASEGVTPRPFIVHAW